MRRARLALVVVGVLALAGPGAAQNPPEEPPPGVSSIDQYIEQIPTSRGSRVAGAGDEKGQPLPRQVRRQLREQAGADAAALERIATSPAYGAPERPLSGASERSLQRPSSGASERSLQRPLRKSRKPVRAPRDDDSSLSGAVSAAATAPGEGGEWRLGVLAGVLVGTTAALGASAYRRRGRPS